MVMTPGRFEGDLDAVLEFSELEPKKKYRVRVNVWRKGTDPEYPGFAWYRSSNVLPNEQTLGGFPPEKYFRKMENAVAYLHQVKTQAEIRRLKFDESTRKKHGWRTLID